MKKSIIVLLSSCILLAFTAYFTNVEAGSELVKWYQQYSHQVDKLETTVEKEQTRLEKEITVQNDATIQSGREKITAFYEEKTEHSKQDIGNYQRAYLSRLEGAEDSLKENILGAFLDKKKAEINLQISEDVEDYLADLLAD